MAYIYVFRQWIKNFCVIVFCKSWIIFTNPSPSKQKNIRNPIALCLVGWYRHGPDVHLLYQHIDIDSPDEALIATNWNGQQRLRKMVIMQDKHETLTICQWKQHLFKQIDETCISFVSPKVIWTTLASSSSKERRSFFFCSYRGSNLFVIYRCSMFLENII